MHNTSSLQQNQEDAVVSHPTYSMHVGICFMLLMFFVLTLISFGILSIATAKADLRLSEKYQENNKTYYDAFSAKEEWLSSLINGQNNSTVSQTTGADGAITATFPMGEAQALVCTAIPSENGYTETECYVMQTTEYTYENKIHVWDPE